MKDFKPANKSSGRTYHQDSKPIQNKKGPTVGGLAKDSLAPKSLIEQAREHAAKQRGEEYHPGSNYPGGAKDSLIQRSLQEQAKYGAIQKKNAASASDSKSKMPPSIQAKMENSFGTDFSNVNIHQGESATAMNALAYTQGNDIHFASGQYNPESQSGQELLGHELTHVVQQRSGSVQPTTQLKGVGVNDDKELEKEADENGKKASEGKEANVIASTNSTAMQLKEDDELKVNPDGIIDTGSTAHASGLMNEKGIYIVAGGGGPNGYDTLYSIAKRFCTSEEAIIKLNNLSSDSLKAGDSLKIPVADKVVLNESKELNSTSTGFSPLNDLNVSKSDNTKYVLKPQVDPFKEKTPANGEEIEPSKIKTEDVKYEYIAHGLAYLDEINPDGNKLINYWGYNSNWVDGINDKQTGLFCGLITPKDDKLGPNPVLAFRGTEDLQKDLGQSDGDPYAVGYTSFMLNWKKIKDILDKVKNKVDLVGHSLGGALAQHAAVEFPDKIRRVVTFQAPGINPEQSKEFNKLINKPSFTNHIAEGDIVDTAGMGHLDGNVYSHYREKNMYVEAGKYIPFTTNVATLIDTGQGLLTHTDFLFTSNLYQKQQNELLPTGWTLQDMINAVCDPKDKDKKKPFKSTQNPTISNEYPHPYKNFAAETGRNKMGHLLDLQAFQINQIKNEEVVSIPLKARIILLKELTTNIATEEAELAICKLIINSPERLAILPEIGLVNILKSILSQNKLSSILDYYRHYEIYKKLSYANQLSVIKDACAEGTLCCQELIVDLLTSIPGPHARTLITQVGKNSNFRLMGSSDYEAGYKSLKYLLTGKFESIFVSNFTEE